MSTVPSTIMNFHKQYVLKLNGAICETFHPVDFFKEGMTKEMEWKWMYLPMKMSGRKLNKLVFYNQSKKDLEVSLLIRYEMENTNNLPFVYYSPSREAIVFFDGSRYRLFGGVSAHSNEEKFSTICIDLDKWGTGVPFPMQPLSKKSEGWGIEYTFALKQGMSTYLYDWEFSNGKLHDIEEVHSQYQDLLRLRKEGTL